MPWFYDLCKTSQRANLGSQAEVWLFEKIWARIKGSELAQKSVGPYNDRAAKGPLRDEHGRAE